MPSNAILAFLAISMDPMFRLSAYRKVFIMSKLIGRIIEPAPDSGPGMRPPTN